jgi:hypothetical protein
MGAAASRSRSQCILARKLVAPIPSAGHLAASSSWRAERRDRELAAQSKRDVARSSTLLAVAGSGWVLTMAAGESSGQAAPVGAPAQRRSVSAAMTCTQVSLAPARAVSMCQLRTLAANLCVADRALWALVPYQIWGVCFIKAGVCNVGGKLRAGEVEFAQETRQVCARKRVRKEPQSA